MLVMVQACTPPLLLAGPLGRKKLEPWRGILHSCNVVLAVLLSRFAIFDIVAVRAGAKLDSMRSASADGRCVVSNTPSAVMSAAAESLPLLCSPPAEACLPASCPCNCCCGMCLREF